MQHKLINVDTVHSERVFNVYILAEHLGMHAPLFLQAYMQHTSRAEGDKARHEKGRNDSNKDKRGRKC